MAKERRQAVMDTRVGIPGAKTLYLMQILLQRTDERHALNATDLCGILDREYGVHVTRQTIYTEIAKLQDYGLDINKVEDSKLAGYYVGVRDFELPELKLLVDAVQASRFITEKKSRQLIDKLTGLCSEDQAKELKAQVIMYQRPKTENETIYYNVDELHTAIFQNRQVTYQYAEWTVHKKLVPRHEGTLYEVSPLSLLWDDENYYLVAYDEKAGKIKHYRVDKIQHMTLLEKERSAQARAHEVEPVALAKKTFGMFGGQDERVRLRCRNGMAGVVIDRFGTDIWMHPEDEGYFAAEVTVTVSPQFYGWLTAVGEGIEIVAPEGTRRGYREYLRNVLSKYDADGER